MSKQSTTQNLDKNKGCFKIHWFFFIIGWSFTIVFIYDTYQTLRTQSWKPIEAIVQSTKLDIIHASDSGSPIYNLDLNYRYQIDNISYNGNRLAKSMSKKNRLNAERLSIRDFYKEFDYAKKIQVFYNPENHSDSVVINKFTNTWYNFLWVVLLINSILYGLMFAFKKDNKYYLLLPLFVFVITITQVVTKVKYIDTISEINVIEVLSPNDCKFIKRDLQENVEIEVNDFRMTENHSQYNRSTSSYKENIIDTLTNTENSFQVLVDAIYFENGKRKSMFFKLNYDKLEGCEFKFKTIEPVN